MYNDDADMLFPSRAMPKLADLRGEAWKELVKRVVAQEETSLDHLGFVLLMVRLGNCTSCQADSYRAMRGCTQCARQTVRRYRGDDKELIARFEQARKEMAAFVSEGQLETP